MVRAFERAFHGETAAGGGRAPRLLRLGGRAPAQGYRARRSVGGPGTQSAADGRPVTIVTGAYGARALAPLVAAHQRSDVEVLAVENRFFGGNIGVAGLLTGVDVARALGGRADRARVLLPDACLSEGRFLDGLTLDDLPGPVEVVPCDGASLRAVLDGHPLAGVLEGADAVGPAPATVTDRRMRR